MQIYPIFLTKKALNYVQKEQEKGYALTGSLALVAGVAADILVLVGVTQLAKH